MCHRPHQWLLVTLCQLLVLHSAFGQPAVAQQSLQIVVVEGAGAKNVTEQIPARLLPDAIKNTAVKITHRLPAADDRDAVGATMNANPEQSRYLVTLPTGQAAVFADGMDFPVLVKIKDGTERDVAAVPRTADARVVVSRRSATCGGECAGRQCTLRELRGAQRS